MLKLTRFLGESIVIVTKDDILTIMVTSISNETVTLHRSFQSKPGRDKNVTLGIHQGYSPFAERVVLICLTELKRKRVRLGISAPKSYRIYRSEVYSRVQAGQGDPRFVPLKARR